MTLYASSAANVIRSLLQHPYVLSVYTKDLPYVLNADIAELDMTTSRMILNVEYSGTDIQQYLPDDEISFDLEVIKGTEFPERETYSLSHIAARSLKTDTMLYRLECQLPESIFATEKRGDVRIPFILGMQARVNIDVYHHALNISGKLKNLSVGGCMIEIDLVESIALEVGQIIPGITLAFANGEHFFAEGKIRHIRPFGSSGHAALGIQFMHLQPPASETLYYFVNESEREAAFRSGMTSSMVYPSPLFIAGAKEKKILQRENEIREKRTRQTPMEQGVQEVAHRLQIGLMYMKSQKTFPHEIFYDCVDTLLYLVRKDRKSLLYALAILRDEPDWVRQAVQVAAKLADMMLLRDPHNYDIREAVLGALLHTLGKPLLISADLPSLKINMNPAQKTILRGHVAALRSKLEALGWEPAPVCADVIDNASERLDGAGYPQGKTAAQLSQLAQLVSIIKMVNKLVHTRNGRPPRSPLEAYRKLYNADSAYDRETVIEYIQTYGLYPIGSLAKYAGGYLGWVVDIENKGKPCKVHIVKNLRFPDTNISSMMSKGDLAQLGRLEKIVNPADYGISVVKE
ncbi:PilZ domain-containing protein [Kosakonia sp. H02]|nr:PilZ domain-containing protein [Kosakonia sp. H02]